MFALHSLAVQGPFIFRNERPQAKLEWLEMVYNTPLRHIIIELYFQVLPVQFNYKFNYSLDFSQGKNVIEGALTT